MKQLIWLTINHSETTLALRTLSSACQKRRRINDKATVVVFVHMYNKCNNTDCVLLRVLMLYSDLQTLPLFKHIICITIHIHYTVHRKYNSDMVTVFAQDARYLLLRNH